MEIPIALLALEAEISELTLPSLSALLPTESTRDAVWTWTVGRLGFGILRETSGAGATER